MSENRFLSYIASEGIVLTVLGLCLLIFPKVTSMSFGFMLCLSLIFYGFFKMIVAIMTKNIVRNYVLDVFIGLVALVTGIILFFAPVFDIMFVIGLLGVYFVLKSISLSSFGIQVRKLLGFWHLLFFISIFNLLFGIITIISIPSGALWLAGILIGTDFILSGFVLINIYTEAKHSKI